MVIHNPDWPQSGRGDTTKKKGESNIYKDVEQKINIIKQSTWEEHKEQ